MLRTTTSALILGSSVGLAGSALAAPLPIQTYLGAFFSPGVGGAYGYQGGIHAPATNGPPAAANIGPGHWGADFGGPSLVNSFTLDQVNAATRHRPAGVRIFNETGAFWDITLADTQNAQVIDLTAINGGLPIPATYLRFHTTSLYTSGASDPLWGQVSLTFDGTFIAPETGNVNAGNTNITSATSLNPVTLPLSRLTDGIIDAFGSTAHGTFWAKNAGQDSFTINYASPQDIESVGLSFDAGLGLANSRVIPKFLTVTGSDNVPHLITLDVNSIQYQRYLLPGGPIMGTSFLTVTFPNGNTNGDWYNIGADANYGMTEFEAFEFVPIPEPAAGLLTAAAMLLSARQRR